MNDIGMIEDAVLAIGDFKGEPDRAKLYKAKLSGLIWA